MGTYTLTAFPMRLATLTAVCQPLVWMVWVIIWLYTTVVI